jgi:hypothetical protein
VKKSWLNRAATDDGRLSKIERSGGGVGLKNARLFGVGKLRIKRPGLKKFTQHLMRCQEASALAIAVPSRRLGADVRDQGDHKQYQEDEEQNLRETGECNSHTTEANRAGYDSDEQENQCPVKHFEILLCRFPRRS